MIALPLVLFSYLNTFSRAGIGGLFISLVIFVYFNKSVLFTKRGLSALVVTVVFLVILGMFVSFPFKNILGRIFEPSGIFVNTGDKHNFTSSTYAHGILAKFALRMFFEHPFFGVGYNNFGVVFARMFDPQMDYMVAHSNYLNLLATTGLFGLSINFLIYLKIASFTYSSIKIADNVYLKTLLQGFFAGYIGTLACNAVGEYYNYQFVWFFIALMISTNLISRKNTNQL